MPDIKHNRQALADDRPIYPLTAFKSQASRGNLPETSGKKRAARYVNRSYTLLSKGHGYSEHTDAVNTIGSYSQQLHNCSHGGGIYRNKVYFKPLAWGWTL